MSPSTHLAALVAILLSASASANPVPNPPEEYWPMACTSICNLSTITSYITVTDMKTMSCSMPAIFRSLDPTLTQYPSPGQTSLDCQADNCLREFIKDSSTLFSFCATYTTAIGPVPTTGLPEHASMCRNDPSRVSSACSCIMTASSSSSTYINSISTVTSTRAYNSNENCTNTTSTLSPLATVTSMDCQLDKCLRQMQASFDAIMHFCAMYTTTRNTYTAAFPTAIGECAEDPHAISSACSCIMHPTSSAASTSIEPEERMSETPETVHVTETQYTTVIVSSDVYIINQVYVTNDVYVTETESTPREGATKNTGGAEPSAASVWKGWFPWAGGAPATTQSATGYGY